MISAERGGCRVMSLREEKLMDLVEEFSELEDALQDLRERVKCVKKALEELREVGV